MSRARYALLAGILALLPMLLPLTIDGSLPLLPLLAADFRAGTAQFCVTAAVMGIAAGQLVYGPLSDSFGRKPVLLTSVCLYAAVSAAGAAAPSMEALFGIRFLQGFFACSGVIVARAVIRDLFDREAGARLFSLMMGIHGIMPAIAPGASGLVAEHWGWRPVFAVMAGFGAFTFMAVLLGLAETRRTRHRAAPVLGNFRHILSNRDFRAYAICASFSYAGLFAYFAGAPVGLIQYLGLAPEQYGIAMAVPMIAYIATQIAVARIVHGVGLDRLIRIGAWLAVAAGAGLTLPVLAGFVNVYTLTAPIVLLLMSLAFVIPGTTVGAVSPFPQMAGAASSLLGFIQFMVAAVATAAVGVLDDGTPAPMAGTICFCAIGVLVAATAQQRKALP